MDTINVDNTSPTKPAKLCFAKDVFVEEDFVAADFVHLQREKVELSVLAQDLHTHFNALKHELVEVIHRDYNDFVRLTTDLVGSDKVVDSLQNQLQGFQQEVEHVQVAVAHRLSAFESKLNEQKQLRKQRGTLELMLKTAESVNKIEALLGATTHNAGEEQAWLPEGQLCDRVAGECSKLQLLMTQGQDLPFVTNHAARAQAAQAQLQERLQCLLAAAVEGRSVRVLEHCLRGYAAIHQGDAAEVWYRSQVVKRYVDATVVQARVLGDNGPAALAALYEEVLAWVGDQCTLWRSPELTAIQPPLHFLANSIWAELHQAIVSRLAHIFAPGIPASFHRNYTISMGFLVSLEAYCCDMNQLQHFRATAATTDFLKRWNLPIYFQLRFQELTTSLVQALESPVTTVLAPPGSNNEFQTQGVQCVWEVLQQCIAPDVFVQPLCNRFFKLSLQCISRCDDWLGHLDLDQAGSQQAMGLFLDVETLSTKIEQDYVPAVLLCFGLRRGSEANSACVASFTEAVQLLKSSQQRLRDLVVAQVSTECSEHLSAVRGIAATFRGTGKTLPTQPSFFVQHALQPLRQFLSHYEPRLTPSASSQWTYAIATIVCERYHEHALELLDTVRRIQESIKKLQKGKVALSSASDVSDSDKILVQVYLDVQEFTRQLEAVAVDPYALSSFSSLQGLVQPAARLVTGVEPAPPMLVSPVAPSAPEGAPGVALPVTNGDAANGDATGGDATSGDAANGDATSGDAANSTPADSKTQPPDSGSSANSRPIEDSGSSAGMPTADPVPPINSSEAPGDIQGEPETVPPSDVVPLGAVPSGVDAQGSSAPSTPPAPNTPDTHDASPGPALATPPIAASSNEPNDPLAAHPASDVAVKDGILGQDTSLLDASQPTQAQEDAELEELLK